MEDFEGYDPVQHPLTNDRDGEYHETSYDGEIDAFVVRYPETEQLYWIDIDAAPSRKMDLNYDAAIDHPSINWAEEYELGDEIPP